MTGRTETLLTLSALNGVGPRKLVSYHQELYSLGDYSPSLDLFEGYLGIDKYALSKASEVAHTIQENCKRSMIDVIGFCDPEYPKLLLGITDFPPFLYVRGNSGALRGPCIAIVGTRNATSAGLRLANLLAQETCRQNAAVVSGLALGIDTSAHIGALIEKGVTIAVLAHGLDTIQPRSNAELGERILLNGGALVSEHAPGVPPYRLNFVKRNRIQSGISIASIVVESGEVGGAMHQAQFTINQRRKLFTVISSALEDHGVLRTDGARKLIEKYGATPLESRSDWGRELSAMLT